MQYNELNLWNALPEYRIIPYIQEKKGHIHVVFLLEPLMMSYGALAAASFWTSKLKPVMKSDVAIYDFEDRSPIVFGIPLAAMLTLLANQPLSLCMVAQTYESIVGYWRTVGDIRAHYTSEQYDNVRLNAMLVQMCSILRFRNNPNDSDELITFCNSLKTLTPTEAIAHLKTKYSVPFLVNLWKKDLNNKCVEFTAYGGLPAMFAKH